MIERRRPKWLLTTKSFLFGLAIAGIGIYDWITQNVDFVDENAEQIMTVIGVIVMILRYLTSQPASLKPPEPKEDVNA